MHAIRSVSSGGATHEGVNFRSDAWTLVPQVNEGHATDVRLAIVRDVTSRDDARFHAFMRAGTSSRVCPRRGGSILRLLGRHEIALHVSFRVS